MARNLTNLYISQSFEYLVQLSASAFETGLGVAIPSINITASNAVSSSYAVTASFALNAGTTVDTGSLMKTGSVNSNTLTFTKGDGSTFDLTVATGSASTTPTGSLLTTASAVDNIITFTKGDGTTFPVTVATGSNAVSASYALTASLALNNVLTASSTNDTITFTKGDGTTFNNVINNVSASISSSYATSASYAQNATTAVTASFATNFTASNILVTGLATITSASITNLLVIYETASVIYSSGSNQFGDASNDVQTLYGTVDVKTGPLLVTGSTISTLGFTGSLQGTASYSNASLSASYSATATSSSYAINATSASYANTATSASYAPSTPAFPYTGSAQITGSFAVTGSVGGNVVGNNTDTYTSSAAVQQIVTLTQAEYNGIVTPDANTLYIISGSTPINLAGFATTGSNTFIGNQTITGSLNVTGSITGNVLGNNTDIYTASAPIQQVITLTQAEYNAISASANANTFYVISDSTAFNPAGYATTGSNQFNGNQSISGSLTVSGSATFLQSTVLSGSIRGEVNALSIASNTASLNCALDNFFTLQLVSGSNTLINPSNILPGQTINLRINTTGSGTVSFPTSVKQVSGSAYVPTTTTGVDIVTLISFDSSSLFLANIKNLV